MDERMVVAEVERAAKLIPGVHASAPVVWWCCCRETESEGLGPNALTVWFRTQYSQYCDGQTDAHASRVLAELPGVTAATVSLVAGKGVMYLGIVLATFDAPDPDSLHKGEQSLAYSFGSPRYWQRSN